MDAGDFFTAIASGDRDGVNSALSQDPGLANSRRHDGASTLQWAAYSGRSEIVADLLGAGAYVDLGSACAIGKVDAIPEDVNPDQLASDGFCLLGLAAAFGHNDIVRLLLGKGANPDFRSNVLGKVAPIHAAVFGRNLEGVKLVVEAGADVDLAQEGGFTALMGAAQNGDLAIVRYLLQKGADRSLQNAEGKCAIDLAANDEIRALLA